MLKTFMHTTNIIRLSEMIWEDCNIIIYTEYLGLFVESWLPSGNSRNTKTHADRSLMDKKNSGIRSREFYGIINNFLQENVNLQ